MSKKMSKAFGSVHDWFGRRAEDSFTFYDPSKRTVGWDTGQTHLVSVLLGSKDPAHLKHTSKLLSSMFKVIGLDKKVKMTPLPANNASQVQVPIHMLRDEQGVYTMEAQKADAFLGLSLQNAALAALQTKEEYELSIRAGKSKGRSFDLGKFLFTLLNVERVSKLLSEKSPGYMKFVQKYKDEQFDEAYEPMPEEAPEHMRLLDLLTRLIRFPKYVEEAELQHFQKPLEQIGRVLAKYDGGIPLEQSECLDMARTMARIVNDFVPAPPPPPPMPPMPSPPDPENDSDQESENQPGECDEQQQGQGGTEQKPEQEQSEEHENNPNDNWQKPQQNSSSNEDDEPEEDPFNDNGSADDQSEDENEAGSGDSQENSERESGTAADQDPTESEKEDDSQSGEDQPTPAGQPESGDQSEEEPEHGDEESGESGDSSPEDAQQSSGSSDSDQEESGSDADSGGSDADESDADQPSAGESSAPENDSGDGSAEEDESRGSGDAADDPAESEDQDDEAESDLDADSQQGSADSDAQDADSGDSDDQEPQGSDAGASDDDQQSSGPPPSSSSPGNSGSNSVGNGTPSPGTAGAGSSSDSDSDAEPDETQTGSDESDQGDPTEPDQSAGDGDDSGSSDELDSDVDSSENDADNDDDDAADGSGDAGADSEPGSSGDEAAEPESENELGEENQPEESESEQAGDADDSEAEGSPDENLDDLDDFGDDDDDDPADEEDDSDDRDDGGDDDLDEDADEESDDDSSGNSSAATRPSASQPGDAGDNADSDELEDGPDTSGAGKSSTSKTDAGKNADKADSSDTADQGEPELDSTPQAPEPPKSREERKAELEQMARELSHNLFDEGEDEQQEMNHDQMAALEAAFEELSEAQNRPETNSNDFEFDLDNVGVVEGDMDYVNWTMAAGNEQIYKSVLKQLNMTKTKVLQKLFAQKRKQDEFTLKGMRSGRFDTNKLVEAVQGVQTVYERIGTVTTNKVCVGVLIDESGSMGGGANYKEYTDNIKAGMPALEANLIYQNSSKIKKAQQAAIFLNECFGKMSDVQFFVYGHSADEEIMKGRRKNKVAYESSTDLYVYREPGKRCSPWGLGDVEARGCNRDGKAILLAAQRIRRFTKDLGILIVISDGAPNAINYDGMAAVEDTKHQVSMAERMGFQVIQVAIDSSVPSHEMFSHFVKMTDIKTLPNDLVRYMSRKVGQMIKSTVSV